MRHAEGRANIELGVHRFDGAERLALRNTHHMRGAHAVNEIVTSRGMNPPPIAKKGEDPRLIENAPMLDTVAEGARDDFGVFREAAGQVAIRPASRVFQLLRQVPMI